jgi:fatty-acyl-CoA synthase
VSPLRQSPATALAVLHAGPAGPALLSGGLPGLVRRRARQTPQRVALATPQRRLTWLELEREVNRAAHFWRNQGITRDQTVAILAGNRVEVLIHTLGLARMGAHSALLNPQLTHGPLSHVLRASRAVTIVTDAAHRPALDTVDAAFDALPAWSFDPSDDPRTTALAPTMRTTPHTPARAARGGPSAVFTYLFTSGTTGRPKAVPITSVRTLLPGLGLQALVLRATANDVLFTPLPLAHASALLVGLSTAWVAGATFAFCERFSAHTYWQDAAAVGATVGIYVGELCRYLLAVPPQPGDQHHRLHTFMGNGLRGDVWPAFQRRFGGPRVIEFYGATEGNAFLVNRSGKVGSCGRPLLPSALSRLTLVRYDARTDTHPRDAKGRLIPVNPGEPGELLARISRLPHERFDGYLDARATQAKVLADGPNRWFRTGDLLRRDADGDYHFVDRIGDTFRWKGENVSTQEVAELLSEQVEAITVYGVTVPGHEGRAGMAAITTPLFDPQRFYAATQQLQAAARPIFVRLMPALDRTATMKFKKARLQAEGFSAEIPDALWIRDPAAATYVPLDATHRDALSAGTLRL